MKFNMKLQEIQYIQKEFAFGDLLGIEKSLLPVLGIEKKLIKKEVLTTNSRGNKELSSLHRYLFSSWKQMRYSVVRADMATKNSILCVLANEEEILVLAREKDDVDIELLEYSVDMMDRIIRNFVGFEDSEQVAKPFNITLSLMDAEALVSAGENESLVQWSQRLGISSEQISTYQTAISVEESAVLMCEDHVANIGSLTKIVRTPAGIAGLKHITPEDLSQERMVLTWGNLQQVLDSVYVF